MMPADDSRSRLQVRRQVQESKMHLSNMELERMDLSHLGMIAAALVEDVCKEIMSRVTRQGQSGSELVSCSQPLWDEDLKRRI